jgi:hypothetical protein
MPFPEVAVDPASAGEKHIEEFLSAKPSWLRKYLQGDYSLSAEEQFEMRSVNWPEVYEQARDEYLEVLKRCPTRLRDYRERERKRGAESALWDVRRASLRCAKEYLGGGVRSTMEFIAGSGSRSDARLPRRQRRRLRSEESKRYIPAEFHFGDYRVHQDLESYPEF